MFSKAEFAAKCGMSPSALAVYIGRGKVVLDGEKIDISENTNNAFLIKYSRKNSTKATDFDIETGDKSNLETERLRLQNEKFKAEIEKLNLNNTKVKGNVVPSPLLHPLILQHNQSIITESKNTITDIVLIISKQCQLTLEQVAFINKEWTVRLNEMMKKSTAKTIDSIDELIQEYSLKRGVGERE